MEGGVHYCLQSLFAPVVATFFIQQRPSRHDSTPFAGQWVSPSIITAAFALFRFLLIKEQSTQQQNVIPFFKKWVYIISNIRYFKLDP